MHLKHRVLKKASYLLPVSAVSTSSSSFAHSKEQTEQGLPNGKARVIESKFTVCVDHVLGELAPLLRFVLRELCKNLAMLLRDMNQLSSDCCMCWV